MVYYVFVKWWWGVRWGIDTDIWRCSLGWVNIQQAAIDTARTIDDKALTPRTFIRWWWNDGNPVDSQAISWERFDRHCLQQRNCIDISTFLHIIIHTLYILTYMCIHTCFRPCFRLWQAVDILLDKCISVHMCNTLCHIMLYDITLLLHTTFMLSYNNTLFIFYCQNHICTYTVIWFTEILYTGANT